MLPIVTPAAMAEADQRTIAAGTPMEVLMDRAGRAVAWEARQRLGNAYGKRVVVVCGKGNNGGDGLVAARILRGWGVRVDVFELKDGVPEPALDRTIERADLMIDAMFGTGFRGALEGDAALVARRSLDLPTLAIDIPSGIDGSTGAVQGDAVRAVATVTFAAHKPGLVFEPGRGHAGDVRVADIGIELTDDDRRVGLVTDTDVRGWLASVVETDTHKWRSGLLVIGGSGGMTGAPMLVSTAAMRVGAGIVWCAVPGDDMAARASGGEVITKAMPANVHGALTGIADDVRDALDRFRALAVGPGLGTDEATTAVVRELVTTVDAPLVLDADGLNAFAGHSADLRARNAPTVLTPHEGEFERLLGDQVGDDRLAAARRLADATGCVALLKGPGTVVAEPGATGRVAVNAVDGPWLGTAGTGDVLTGIIAGLLARGLGAFEAAAAGTLVHGLSADVAGHTGLVAGDLVAALPHTFQAPET
ncbi:MAG: NAD(P)H-hydrate dehydratase [Actinobacteria bacterium]|nr:NAD(P)H-hydrate dehydratase [Actinomycetota bacterium]